MIKRRPDLSVLNIALSYLQLSSQLSSQPTSQPISQPESQELPPKNPSQLSSQLLLQQPLQLYEKSLRVRQEKATSGLVTQECARAVWWRTSHGRS